MSHRMFTLRSVAGRNLAAAACLIVLAACSDDKSALFEPDNIRKSAVLRAPSIETLIFDDDGWPVTSEVQAGVPLIAQVKLTGSGPVPTGTVTFRFYENGSCAWGTPFEITSGLNAQGVASVDRSVSALGTYAIQAVYSGDDIYAGATGACTPFSVVDKLTPVVTFELLDLNGQPISSTLSGTPFMTKVKVSGASWVPTGTVQIVLYKNGECGGVNLTDPSTHPSISTLSLLPNGEAAITTNITVAEATTRSYWVLYSGDGKYDTAGSNCVPFSILTQLTPQIVTTVHDDTHQAVTAVPVGANVHARTVVSGSGPTPTGDMVIAFFENATCSGSPKVSVGASALDASGTNDFDGYQYNWPTPGDYALQAFYEGDVNYTATYGSCTPFAVVDPASPTPTPVTKSGSIGYWRNAGKHYSPAQLQLLLDFLKSNNDAVFNHDQTDGTSDDLTAAKLAAIFEFGKKPLAQQNVLAHLTALALDLALTQLAPQHNLSQPNSGICTAGGTDVTGISGASALFGTTSPTIGQVVNFVAQRWDGSLTDKRTDWSFNLTQSQLSSMLKTLSGINDGSLVTAAGC